MNEERIEGELQEIEALLGRMFDGAPVRWMVIVDIERFDPEIAGGLHWAVSPGMKDHEQIGMVELMRQIQHQQAQEIRFTEYDGDQD